MTKFSPEYLCLADELLNQYALTQDDQLSGILTKENLDHFQSQYTGGRVRDFPPLKTLKTSNSGYCKARQRLTEASLMTLLTQSGNNLDSASPESWLWFKGSGRAEYTTSVLPAKAGIHC